MTSEGEEPIVIERRTKGRISRDLSKRVSFDADIFGDRVAVELKSFECGSSKKVVYDSRSNEKRDSCKDSSSSRTNSRKVYPPLLERGAPEGQEDPERYSSVTGLSESAKDFSPKNLSDDSYAKFEAALVKKSTKTIPRERALPKIRDVLVATNRIAPLHVSRVKRSDLEDYSVVTESLSDEIAKNAPRTRNIASFLKPSLLRLVASLDNRRTLYKAYKVLTVDGSPVLAVITSESLCFVGHDDVSNQFSLRYCCDFENMLAAVVGPFSQLVIVLDENRERFFMNTGLSESTASELISHLELAMRRWCMKTKKEFNFNVAQIYDLKHMSVFHSLLPENAFVENEVVMAQYSIWLQEDYVETASPLGPEKEGHLMTKVGMQLSWVPLYVCLKGGVLYLFEKNSQRIPKSAIPLRSSCYKGCRIRNNAERPHTFEILLEDDSAFSFGAADELEMMEWIRCIYSSAIQISNVEILDSKKESPVVNCFVTLSSNQILLHRFPNEIISRAFLDNITSFTKSSWPNSYYCLLELCCREASEMGGDWIMYFVSKNSFQSFCSRFAEIANESITMYQVEDERFLTHKSDRISAKIRSSWDSYFT